jgi:hypothetical protein
MDIISIHETSIILGLPEFLIRDFVSYEFNGRKLACVHKNPLEYIFELSEVDEFREHLDKPWPGTDRIPPPDFIRRYLKYESQGCCALCRNAKPNYEYAHIRPWPSSRCNNPHNLLHLCLDCHRSYGNDAKLLGGVKEESLRRIQLVDLSLLYECGPDMKPGEAVYVLEGRIYRAHVRSPECMATGFIKTKIGIDRCIVQRYGVVTIGGLEPGEDYVLSSNEPGRIETRAQFDANRDLTKEANVQFLGRAESNTQLAIRGLGLWITAKPGPITLKKPT